MRIPALFGFALAASTLAMLAARSGAGEHSVPVPGAQTQFQAIAFQRLTQPQSAIPREMRNIPPVPISQLRVGVGRDTGTAMGGVYVAQFVASTVNEYAVPDRSNKGPFCMISGVSAVNNIGVQPITRELFIPDGGSRTIKTYAPACGAAGLVLNDTKGQPSDVAFNGQTGTVYVTNIFNNGAPGTVEVYKKGEINPSSELSDPAMNELLGIDTDSKGNVFQSFLTSGGSPGLIEFPGGKMPGKLLNLTGIGRSGGVEFDKHDFLGIVDSAAPAAVDVYRPPYNGAPLKTVVLKGASIFGKLDAANQNCYVVSSQNGSLDVYSVPSGTYEYSVTNGLSPTNDAEGVAVDLPD